MENPKTTTALVSKRKTRLRPHYSGLCQVAACLCSLTATSTNAHPQIASASHAISALPLGRTKNKEIRSPETQTGKTPAFHGVELMIGHRHRYPSPCSSAPSGPFLCNPSSQRLGVPSSSLTKPTEALQANSSSEGATVQMKGSAITFR